MVQLGVAMTTFTCIKSIAGHHLGVISGAKLASLGFSRSAIRHLVATGRLRRAYAGVYLVEGSPDTPQQRALAAVVACGRGAVLSHVSAAVLWGLLDYWPDRPQVTVPRATGGTGRTGIELHHSTTLGAQTTRHDGIPVTTLWRTLIDIAPRLRAPTLKAAVRQAERRHSIDLKKLRAHIEHPRNSPKLAPLRTLLDRYVTGAAIETQGELEPLFFELCADHGIPLPDRQVPFGPYLADFVWHDVRLIVETDDRGSHDGYVAFREDRVKDRALKRYGYEVLRFTWEEVTKESEMVAAELLQALARRRAELALS